jgi:diguanylate cyclase (GGDEF)-like protein
MESLPTRRGPPQGTDHAGERGLAPSAAAILIVDDDVLVREHLATLLESVGYEVAIAGDGREALECIGRTAFDLALVDCAMPVVDGLEFCHRLRQSQRSDYTYVMMLSGRDGAADVVAGLNAGADDFVSKRATRDEILARVRTALRMVARERALRCAATESERIALLDPLTSVFNRRYLMSGLAHEIERSRRYGHCLTVMMLDLDRFKQVNDRHGHAAGDQVLQQFAARVGLSLRDGSDWCARYGGEEFVVVLPETALAGALIAADKLRNATLALPFQTDAGALPVTTSIGVTVASAVSLRNGVDAAALLGAADRLLYECKVRGRNRVVARPFRAMPQPPKTARPPGAVIQLRRAATAPDEAAEVTPSLDRPALDRPGFGNQRLGHRGMDKDRG